MRVLKNVLSACLTLALAASIQAGDGRSRAGYGYWPQWRGPAGTGVASFGDPPTEWSPSRNIAWRRAIPGRGHSTPIVWADRLFLVTAVSIDKEIPVETVVVPGAPKQPLHADALKHWKAQRFVILCLDRHTGEVLWRKVARESRPHQSHHRKGSFASASPVTDGERLYAYFGSFGLYCFDFDGRIIWETNVGPFQMEADLGEGSSPALHGQTLVINADHEGQSFIVALDKMTGKELWRREREEISTWSTPVIFDWRGRTQVVSNATRVRCYDLATGELLWQCAGQTESAVPVPVVGHGMVFVTSGFAKDVFHAIRLGGRGDLTATDAIAWSLNRGTPYVPSPLLWGDELYLLEDQGFFSCFDAGSGERHYFKERLPGINTFSASPVGVSWHIYLLSESGDTYVLKRGPEFELIGVNPIEEACYASPVVVGEALYLRGGEHLYCIREPLAAGGAAQDH